MSNAKLIKALRLCADDEGDCDGCAYYMQGCMPKMMRDAADALEADERRIEVLEAQMPKEAHWVAVQNGIGVCSNCNRQDSIDNMATHCRYCGARMKGEQHEQ